MIIMTKHLIKKENIPIELINKLKKIKINKNSIIVIGKEKTGIEMYQIEIPNNFKPCIFPLKGIMTFTDALEYTQSFKATIEYFFNIQLANDCIMFKSDICEYKETDIILDDFLNNPANYKLNLYIDIQTAGLVKYYIINYAPISSHQIINKERNDLNEFLD